MELLSSPLCFFVHDIALVCGPKPHFFSRVGALTCTLPHVASEPSSCLSVKIFYKDCIREVKLLINFNLMGSNTLNRTLLWFSAYSLLWHCEALELADFNR